ncbi:MAG: RNA polymerase sigma factor [Alphaproteobacteria bacterium]|nr:RNA polymerase sigma factor [Alphaproteobacteria bacterium]
MNKPEDDTLISSARNGDSRAFEMLINRHYERMFAIAFKWTRNRADAEDVTQTACINMAKGIRRLHNEKTFTTWLYRIVVNAAKDFFRQNNRTQTLPDNYEPFSEALNPEEELYMRERLEEIYALPEKERDALLLVFGEGLNHRETAQVLGCAETTISWRIHKARNHLNSQREKKG